eukprot:6208018-Pleurochrysis_carterae.AAC.5
MSSDMWRSKKYGDEDVMSCLSSSGVRGTLGRRFFCVDRRIPVWQCGHEGLNGEELLRQLVDLDVIRVRRMHEAYEECVCGWY